MIQLGNADCHVIGINDYFSVAGYKEVLRRLGNPSSATEGNQAYREALSRLRQKTLFPVVECRMTNIVIGKRGRGPRTNFHLVFDPIVSTDDIETFIKGLKVKDQSIGSRYNNATFLKDACSVDFNAVRKSLSEDVTFRDKFLIWIPYDEYGGIDEINPATDKLLKEGLVWHADILGSSRQKQADFFLWKDERFSIAQYKSWFGRRKPCIKGSDSHNTNDEIGRLKDHESRPIDKYCWIKGNPTFAGLRQITNEPEGRVYIGRLPPKLEEVSKSSTRYIDIVEIRQKDTNGEADTWFDCCVPLSPDMVAIIGNKGSGKSALADIIALSGNTHCDPRHFSFLTKDRFCERNGRIAKRFEVRLTWADGTTVVRSLDDKPDLTDVERVKYIPQTYLEKVCTETTPGEKSEFQSELRKVIFSHIADEDRLGRETLDDLIDFKTTEIREQLAHYRHEVTRVNEEIAKLEEKAEPEFAARIKGHITLKEQELAAHIARKPAPIQKPSDRTPDQDKAAQRIMGELEEQRSTLKELEGQITVHRERRNALTEHIVRAQKIGAKIDNFQAAYDRLVKEMEEDASALALEVGDIVHVMVDRSTLAAMQRKLAEEKSRIDGALSPENPEGIVQRVTTCRSRLRALQEKLDEPNKRYQEYVEALNVWNVTKLDIEGAPDRPDTLQYYVAELNYVTKELPSELSRLGERRASVARALHAGISAVRDTYKEMFASVQKLIEDSAIIREGYGLTFESSIVEHQFQREIFADYVNQGVAGSFCGREQGAVRLEKLRVDYDFNSGEDVVHFLEAFHERLTHDHRSAKRGRVKVAHQLRKHVSKRALYDYLWSLDYLQPEYSLRLDGRELSQLSPGERGTLLLVFYLLVDTSVSPIIVDQPEENLDNHTVYRLLIPVIKDVKKRRQLIMVTHSPNIAVVCDAEQIVHASIDRANRNEVTYSAGAIEAAELNRHAVDVLEGTRPAFDNRSSKYLLE
ncbi:MAG: hypothetical protein F4Y71_00150 [Acidobacteria bacterium]|nr:hypothetical protein [Acidobacteriota bacterium]MYG75072.1 hypothetical protein [Acidobacteriota bacterium]